MYKKVVIPKSTKGLLESEFARIFEFTLVPEREAKIKALEKLRERLLKEPCSDDTHLLIEWINESINYIIISEYKESQS